jgi:hypothetical protein
MDQHTLRQAPPRLETTRLQMAFPDPAHAALMM